jgi:hypothetical protein
VSTKKPAEPITPERLARSGTEHGHQAALFCWRASALVEYPDLKWMFAIPNGGQRGIVNATRLKAEGVRAGVSDIFLPVVRMGQGRYYAGLFIEMKKPSVRPKRSGAGGVSDDQSEFGKAVQAQGYGYAVCYSWEEARDVITAYLRWS